MAQAMVNFRMDSKLKADMEKACKEMRLPMSSAFTVFAAKVARERRIPFEICADPFYSEENMSHLRKVAAGTEAGQNMASHKLIEVN